jgi:segregation and condensation protein B
MIDDGVRDESLARLEALLFAADEPLGAKRLAKLLELPLESDAVSLVERLNAILKADGSAFVVQSFADGYQLSTRPDLADRLQRWLQTQEVTQPSEATLKTLAVVAYRQPVTRADVDALRGAPSAEILRNLVDSGWVQIVGQEETLGRPHLYGTTRKFLQEFGLRNLGDLPTLEGLSKDTSRP